MKHRETSGREQALQKITVPLSFIIFFSVLNGTMFQVAIPDIATEFRLIPSEVSWVMTGYILVFAVGSLMYGKLADLYPVKHLITAGLLLMNGGSLLGFFSIKYSMLIAARLLQAGGGAAIPALAMIVATRYFPAGLRGKVLGLIAATVALAAGIGPVLGGFISGSLHWRYLFLASLLTIFTIPVFRGSLPDERKQAHPFDTRGAVLIAAGTSLLLISVTEGDGRFLVIGLLILIWFAWHISRAEGPFVTPSLFSNHPYRNTVITTFLSLGTVFGMMFMVPIMLRDLNSLDANRIGLVMFPGAMTAVFMGVLGGRLSDRKGSTFVAYLGSGFLISGFLLLSSFAGQAPWIISLQLIICYTGFSFLQSALPHTVSRVLSRDQTGIGMGIYNLFFFISGAFSTAGIGKLLDRQSAGYCLNPLTSSAAAWIYSNIFIMLAVVVAAALLIFRLTFLHTFD